jgi:hypothetical protein
MAGTWIIMKHDLQTSPEVRRITRKTGAESVHTTIGRLHAVWSWADTHSDDGVMIMGPEDLDDIAGCEGFAQAMQDAGWLTIGDDSITFPNFGDHNGKTAKRRAKDAARKGAKRAMSAKCPQNVRIVADKTKNTEQDSTEQRRENAARSPVSDGETPPRHEPPKSAMKRATPVQWDGERGFIACSFRRLQWAKAYPLVDLNHELGKAHAWYIDNPGRRKRDHGRFLGNWLSNAQERAEQDAKAGKRAGVHLNDQHNIVPDDPDDHPLAKLRGKNEARNAG